MRKTREVLRLKFACGMSHRQIARSCQVSPATVTDYMARALVSGLTWEEVASLNEEALDRRLFPVGAEARKRNKPLPDFPKVYQELRGHKNLTLTLLWQEYKEAHPDGYQFSQFCRLFVEWRGTLGLVMRQHHPGGEKLFVDYCDGPLIPDPATGEQVKTQIWVGTWGASNYTYAEASFSQDLANWMMSHAHAFHYFQCVPRVTVPDNLRSGVTDPCYYEPNLNPTYAALAEHYQTTVIPARPRKPRDKAKVENGVLLVQRWILARLRHRSFLDLAELNQAIRELLETLNTRPMRKLKKSRRELFQTLDKPNALPLPLHPYEYAAQRRARVNIDYHVQVENHYYSVPCQLVHQMVDVRLTAAVVEIFHKGVRVASHPRSFHPWQYSTLSEHMPHAHRFHAEWTPSRMIDWARKTGPKTAKLFEGIFSTRQHPEQGYRSCLGILRLERRYGRERVEKAAERALRFKSFSFKSMKKILERGLDQETLLPVSTPALPLHENIRGSRYYEMSETTPPPRSGTPTDLLASGSRTNEEHSAEGAYYEPIPKEGGNEDA